VKYLLALDQGTSSSRSIVFAPDGHIVGMAQQEFRQIYPHPSWVEHDPIEIWSSQLATMRLALKNSNILAEDIACVGITNQRETTVVWDKHTGQPIHNAIVWQDRRTAHYCDQLKQQGYLPTIQQKTGLIIDAYFSATKLKWLLDNVEGARDKAARGELCFGTIDSWLLWKLTNGMVHATDVSNASRTMLYNIHTLAWDDELLQLMDIPKNILPEVRSSSEVYGHTQNILTAHNIPIAGIAGDQQAALFGQMCTEPGMVKNTYGTGCFMLMNTGEQPVISSNNLLTTIAWQINGVTKYALEGSVFIAGAVVQWLRDGLQLIRSSPEIEELAQKADDNGGVYIVPAFAGLGAPYWNQHARGTIVGITRGTTSAHFARAALESIAYQTMDVVNAMQADAGVAVKELRVDGGATVNNLLMQFQSDILNTTVIRPRVTETTALGAAYLAGLAVGYWGSPEEIQKQWLVDTVFTPTVDEEKRASLSQEWQRAIKATQAWTEG